MFGQQEPLRCSPSRDIANGLDTKRARKALPQELHRKAGTKLDFILNAAKLEDFKYPPGNHFEKLGRSDDEYSSGSTSNIA
jgi:proteic killer suppression protein